MSVYNDTMAILKKYKISADKSLGQNFLVSDEVVEGIGNSLVKFNISEFTFNNEDMRSMLSIAKKTYTYLDRNYIDNIKIVDKSEIMRYFESIVMKLRESVKRNVIESNLD